jgi:uncharacterized protein
LKKFAIIVLLFVSLFPALAEINFPAAAGYVNDFTGVLTPQEKQSIEHTCSALKDQTGAEVAVAIVKTTAPLDPKLYAVKLFEKWGIGEKSKDNGVLILLAMEEHRIEIEVGYGLEGILPDAKAGQILDTYAIPHFRQGRIGQGMVETTNAVAKVVAGETVELRSPAKKINKEDVDELIVWVIIGVIVLGILFRKMGSIMFGIFGAFWGASYAGIIGAIFGGLMGLFFGVWGWGMMGRGSSFGGGSFGGGGFGGFGGGGSGGGGAGRSW